MRVVGQEGRGASGSEGGVTAGGGDLDGGGGGAAVDEDDGDGAVEVKESRGPERRGGPLHGHAHGAGPGRAGELGEGPQALRGRDGVAVDADELGVGGAGLRADPVQVARGVGVDEGRVDVVGPRHALAGAAAAEEGALPVAVEVRGLGLPDAVARVHRRARRRRVRVRRDGGDVLVDRRQLPQHPGLAAPPLGVAAVDAHRQVRFFERRAEHFDEICRLGPAGSHRGVACSVPVTRFTSVFLDSGLRKTWADVRELGFVEEPQVRDCHVGFEIVLYVLHQVVGVGLSPVAA